ncbi:MAG: bifunctional oligoribonuclease/PAP phosphatase NrnA [Armatimonadetes bacterium]|nr:bifunctional oligoribonuclease/PAP phosphatase NrnA [Armatimonadota bacterium]
MSGNFKAGHDLLRKAGTFFITGHVNPDGDAVGSLLGLGHALMAAGKRVTMALQDPVPASCRFLPGSELIQSPPVSGPFDLAVVVDCEGPFRAGVLEKVVKKSPKVLVIDHHLSKTHFGTVEIRDTSAAATGEILTDFLHAGGYPMTEAIAQCLMAAIILDTGGLRYPSVTVRTLRTAAVLREAGADLPRIYRELFENRSFPSVKLMGIAMSNLERSASGEIVYSWLRREDFENACAGDNDTDGINIQLMSIEGVEASALFREGPSGGIRVSLRSRDRLDCNAVARAFGGGGHLRASGCTVDAPLPEAIRQVVDEMEKRLYAETPDELP